MFIFPWVQSVSQCGWASLNQKRFTKSTINHQPQPSNTKHQASITNHQPPNISQSSGVNHRTSAIKTKAPNIKHQSPNIDQSSGINHQSPTIQHQPMIASITAPVPVKYDRQDGVDIQRQLVGRQLDQVRMSPDGLQNQGVKVLLSAVVQGKHETTPSLGARGVGCGL